MLLKYHVCQGGFLRNSDSPEAKIFMPLALVFSRSFNLALPEFYLLAILDLHGCRRSILSSVKLRWDVTSLPRYPLAVLAAHIGLYIGHTFVSFLVSFSLGFVG